MLRANAQICDETSNPRYSPANVLKRVRRTVRCGVVWFSKCALLVVGSTADAGPKSSAFDPLDPRTAVAAQIVAEAEVVDNAIAAVDSKLRAGDALRARRLVAAIRTLHAALPRDATADERMVVARRSAAARLLLSRDAAERRLLVDELTHLRVDATRIATAAAQVRTIQAPTNLVQPAGGTIARQFGDYIHERSKATLSRRGIDLEVESHAQVVAPADGVIRYAGSIRGLDRGVIIDHGTFFTIVAKLGDIEMPAGTRVAHGDRIARAATHRVYFEVRVKVGPGGLPIDPQPLLKP